MKKQYEETMLNTIGFADCPHCLNNVDILVHIDDGAIIGMDHTCPECGRTVDCWENLTFENIVLGDTGIVIKENKLTSPLHSHCTCQSCLTYNAMIDGMESLILALYCAGIDYHDPAFLQGINDAIVAINNNAEDCTLED